MVDFLVAIEAWLFGSNRELTFDPTILLGWNQHHYKNYWILYKTTAHKLKS